MTDAEMIEAVDRWPLWPTLPMKKRRETGGYETGWITADCQTVLLKQQPNTKGILLQIWLEFDQKKLDELGVFKPPPVPDAMRSMYEDQVIKRDETVEMMLSDGWMVD